jgi:hypothetical protein
MVNLTNIAAARVSPTLYRRADDIIGRKGFGRKNIPDKDVPFIEVTPMALKNRVSNRSTKDRNKACFNEMMEAMACMSKFDQNQNMCSKEIDSLNSCYKSFNMKRKEAGPSNTKDIPVGQRAKMSGQQLSDYMQKFSQSKRQGQAHDVSAFKKI